MYEEPILNEKDLEGRTDAEIDMLKIMGFCDFDSTAGKPVQNNDIYVSSVRKERRYRQYMNRRGGFNRPLDHVNWLTLFMRFYVLFL